MPYKTIQKTGKYPGRQYLNYLPNVPGEFEPATLELLQAHLASKKATKETEKAFVDQFTADLKAKGWDGEPWINVYEDKVSVAQDDGKGSNKKNMIPADEIDLRKASVVLRQTVPMKA